jgi:hypothetical protein
VAVLALGGAALAWPAASAQEATPSPAAAHPFVGAWVVDTDATDAANFPALAVAGADGTYVESHPEVGVGVGSWVPTGPQTVELTVVFRVPSETGAPMGIVTAHAAVEVSAGGDGWQAPYALEAVAPGGAVLFTGEGQARATRVGVVPMAGMATPAATPAP